VRIAPTFAFAVGVEVSLEAVSISICGTDGVDLANSIERIDGYPDSPRAMALDVFARYNELVRTDGLPDVPASVVIAVPGLVAGPQLTVPAFGWTNDSVSELLRTAPLRVTHLGVLNDGDAAVVAEASLRPHLECVVALHGSEGIGGGVSFRGRLFSGAGGAAGQFGHVIVEANGRPCYCGNSGCLRQYISTTSFARDLGEVETLKTIGFRAYALALAARARNGDQRVVSMLQEAKRRLKQIVEVLGAVLSPETVILTGNLAPLAQWLESPPASATGSEQYRAQWSRPVEGSSLGQDSVIRGAALLARSEILDNPLKFASS
jgi:predicted NBD/HSP70 family sugar kinase